MTIVPMISVSIACLMAMAFGWYLGKRTQWTPWIARGPQSELDPIDALIAAGNYSAAEDRATREQREAEHRHGNDHPRVAWALIKLAEIGMASGSFGTAKTQLERALDIRTREFGKDDHRTVTTRIKLGEWHSLQKNRHQAESIFNEVRETLQRLLRLGQDDPGLAAVHNHLAELQLDAERYDEAEANAGRAIALARHKDGDVADLVTGLTHLAEVQKRQKVLPAARVNYQSALDKCIKAYGKESPRAATCHQNLASIILEQGRGYDVAIEHAKSALDIINARLGPKTLEYAQTLGLLGRLRCARGQYDEGIRLVEEAIKVSENALGPSHLRVINLKAVRKELVDRKFALPRGQGVKEKRDVVLSLLRFAPAAISGLLSEFPDERRRVAAEHVHRLADLQHRAENRLNRLLNAPGTAIDDGQVAANDSGDDVVGKDDWQASMLDYRGRRESLLKSLEKLSNEEWLSRGTQSGRTRTSVLILFRQLALQELSIALQIEECLLTRLNP